MGRIPGSIRDSVISYLAAVEGDASTAEIMSAVTTQLGEVAPSSVRSYLNLNVPEIFERTGRGRYRLKANGRLNGDEKNGHKNGCAALLPAVSVNKAKLFHADCFDWLAAQEPCSIHAVVADPPYGLVEYSERELIKLRNGKGGVWRIPPSFDGCMRSPLPRFTVLDDEHRQALYAFFKRFGLLLTRATVPGANVVIASNPLLAHIVASAMSDAGLELRGNIIRLTMTMRGGDRPKNAHMEFPDVSVMPRSMWEPWVVFRRPLEGRVQDNLRKYRTGGFRRPSTDKPFGDVIKSSPTSRHERNIAPHPSLKPQNFLRRLVRASLPLGEGIVLDPFAGSGSTLAAANAVGYKSIGVEADLSYIKIAKTAIEELALIPVEIDPV
jgi:site-specific DNA-methyltransferase (adenine-specific)